MTVEQLDEAMQWHEDYYLCICLHFRSMHRGKNLVLHECKEFDCTCREFRPITNIEYLVLREKLTNKLVNS